MVGEGVSLVISRQILADLSDQLDKLSDEDAKIVAHYALDKIHTRVISFEEQVNTLSAIQLCGDESSLFLTRCIGNKTR